MSKLKRLIEKANMWEMANLSKATTNLDVIVYISPKQGSYGPRIKFMNGYDKKLIAKNLIPMSIEDNPKVLVSTKLNISSKDLEQIKKWVKVNKQVLLDFWNGKYNDVMELASLLVKV